ncbi:MAG: hypothetical protein IJU70_11140 [Lentisphaeria bacterium]|nr:hypothetical protein [Lentisphaeria bacterium]
MMKKVSMAGAVAALLVVSASGSPYSEAQAKIRERFPEEYAGIQKLAATDLGEAQKKMAELARKGNIALPRESGRSRFGGRDGRDGGRRGMGGMGGMGMMRRFNPLRRFVAESQIRSKFPAEYAAADKELLAAAEKIDELAKKAKVTLPVSTELRMRQLRARAPEDFARLEEQSESDPRAVFGGLRELAEKNGVTLYENAGNGPGPGRGGEVRAGRPSGRENPMQMVRKLRRKYPEEMKEIEALRSEDPKEFSRRLQELNRRYTQENGGEKK